MPGKLALCKQAVELQVVDRKHTSYDPISCEVPQWRDCAEAEKSSGLPFQWRPHGDFPIDLAEVGRVSVFCQFGVLACFFPIAFRLAHGTLHFLPPTESRSSGDCRAGRSSVSSPTPDPQSELSSLFLPETCHFSPTRCRLSSHQPLVRHPPENHPQVARRAAFWSRRSRLPWGPLVAPTSATPPALTHQGPRSG